MRLDGRTAIVTGGANGIGLAIVRRLVTDGARVMIADIDEAAGAAAVEAISGDGEVRFTAADVSERLDVHNLVARTIDAFGSINALVNNAGIVHAADFLDLTEADFDRVMNVNLKSAFLCGQAVARHMVERIGEGDEPGSIVNMSSINDTLAIANQVPYSVSKGGVSQLTGVMALSLAQHGIRVNAVGPGSIMTDMLASVADNPELRTRVLSRTPLGRIGDPSEIAAVTAFLLSSEASYVTGQTIYADGGRMPLNYTVPVKE
ncbi:SDR family NAD(P)-dependent oxidoreductase [Hoeflea ulvae]|uniref:SDR family oxidoreductase n=1 Tax=Hoeflea ulvae TaxID=2983764 RepID=A0ABT3YAA7_9HYPH|nr:SDR family oxidoreductase [Hoeflea ulvae]MCY0092803.1 SDR family oxidoreductase [Hoeflea ulvae]